MGVKAVRFAVIGAGMMGRIHARVGCELLYPELVAIADVDETRARALAEQFNARAYTDFRELLERESLDAVIVTTPETDHREAVVLAAERGCHVFVEKPLATSLEDADVMIAACEGSSVKLMVGYILRFEPCYTHIQEAIAQQAIGRFLSAYARRNAAIEEGRRLGGRISVINYLAVHDADQILWYNPGKAVTRVTARALHGRIMDEFGMPDFSWLWFEFDDGGLGIIECGWALPESWAGQEPPAGWSGFGDVRMDVTGTEGVIQLNLTPMNLGSVRKDKGWMFPETRHWPTVNDRLGGCARLEMEHFFSCVALDRPVLIDGHEARRSLEIAIAAERSIAAGGQSVSLPL
jgi:predicted dehydrogenase